MKKRNRACEECHRLKIKCDLSTFPGGACERCSRNNLECVPTAPRLQRNRINELEAQVQELRNALQNQSSSRTPSQSPSSLLEDHNQATLSFLDARIPLSKQQDLLHLFAHQAGAAWPVIRPPTRLDHIRAKSPILLLSVLVYSVTQETQGTELETHEQLVRETMHLLGDEVIGKGQRPLELVQALLVAAFWSKSTRRGQQGSCYQIIQLAADMAIDLGIAGFTWQPSPAAYFCRLEDTTSLEARRTWLACFVAISTSSMSLRRTNTVPWNAHHQECLLYLESRGEISDRLCLCQLATFVDGNDYSIHVTMEALKTKVDAWAVQIPPSLESSQTLKVLRHVAMVHIYEPVLHTPTNKALFTAPFIPGRIAFKDFPKPAKIIPPLQTALEVIVQNCHAVIDAATDMDPALALSLPSICFPPNVLYSLYVLVTLFVAATDPANTYGQYLTANCFNIEQCGLKLRRLTSYMKALDPTMSCWSTRMFDATGWLEQWYNDYIAILQRYQANLAHGHQ